MKKNFDDLTDLVEHAQANNVNTPQNQTGNNRKVADSQGNIITLNDKKIPERF